MALVGNISGSSNANSLIGVTGSVIFSNNPAGSFPSSLPGTDVQFFVSGSVGGKGGNTRNVAVFGGDTVVSGALTVGSGSVIVTSNDIQLGTTGHIQFGGTAANRITAVGSDLKFFDGNNTGGKTLTELASSGGGGTNFFTENGSGVIYNSGSVAFTGARTGETITAASQKGTDVQFYFSGSTDGSKIALFGGGLVSSGSIKVVGTGTISGSGDISAGGNLIVAGDAAINGGDLTTTSTGTATLFNTNATTVNIAGAATSGTTVGNSTGGVQLNGTATVTGDLAVNGATSADITTITTTATVFNTTATTLNIGGAATAVQVGATTGTTTVRNNLIVKGDLYISGTTTTIDSTTMEIQDPVIGFGFASGSVAGPAGDRGFIGGITGTNNNVAMVWSDTNSSFITAKTNTAPGSSPVVVYDFQPIRASKLSLGGASGGAVNAYVTSSDGSKITVRGLSNSEVIAVNAEVALDAASGFGTSFKIAGTAYGELKNNGTDTQVGAVSGKQLYVSGSTLNLQTAGVTNFLTHASIVAQAAGNVNSNFKLYAQNSAGTTTAFTLSGSSVLIGANSGTTDMAFAGTGLGRFQSVGGTAFQLGSTPGINLNISGSNQFNMIHGSSGISLQQDTGGSYMSFNKNSTESQIFAANSQNIKIGSGLGSTTVILSGSTTTINNAGVSGGTTFQADNSPFAKIYSGGANRFDLEALSGYTTANILNTIATTVNFAGAGTNIAIGAAGSGATYLKNASLFVSGATTFGASVLPSSDKAYDLGSPTQRWANMYTGDLHLRNDRGNWTIIEEEEYLSITNNLSGKRYKFVLQEL